MEEEIKNNKQMKILLLAPASSIHTIRWAKAFSDRGHVIYLVSLANHKLSDESLPDSVCVHYLHVTGTKGYYLNAKELRRFCKDICPDVINVHYASGYGTLARKAKIHPLVLNIWGSDIYDFPNESIVKKAILKRNINNAEAIASTSNCMAQEMRKVVGSYNKNIAITPFGVDVERFKPMDIDNKSKNAFKIGTVKALSYKYGIDTILIAFSIIVEKWKDTDCKGKTPQLFICGRGDNRDEYIKLRKQLGLENYVQIEDYVPHEKVPALLNSFDLCCFGSRYESFGVSAVEAMACEIPVVVTDVDGFREVTVDGYTGYIVQRDNPAAMAEKIWQLYQNDSLRRELGKNGRKQVIKHYKWDNNVTLLEDVLKEQAIKWEKNA